MTLERIVELAAEVAADIEEITGKTLNHGNVKYEVDDGNILNDTDVVRTIEILEEVKADYDWRDHLANNNPWALIKKGAGYALLRLMGESLSMKYNGEEGIAVNPDVFEMKEGAIKFALAHELVHPLDNERYGFTEIRFKYVEEARDLQKELIAEKHKAGFFRGYLRKNEQIKAIETRIEEKKKELNRFMAIVESHANYVQKEYVARNKLQPKDYLNLNFGMVKQLLVAIPLLMTKAYRNKIRQYSRAEKLVKLAYSLKHDLGNLYKDIPSEKEVETPILYFKNRGFSVKQLIPHVTAA